MIEFAWALLDTIDRVNQKFDLSLDMRIGIHKGDIIAGITGSTIVRYDIYGPDVYIANKMESYGLPGRIHISDAVYNVIQELEFNYSATFNKTL